MSQPATHAHPGALKPGAFLESLIRFLMPFFIGTAADLDAARADILETLGSYAARTRAEMLSAARIIAFGMTTLDTLSESTGTDLSPTLKLRYRSCANGLNRATVQTEKALEQSLARAIPAPPPPEAATAPSPHADLLNEQTDAATQATIDAAAAAIQAHRDRMAGRRPTTTQTPTPQDRNKQLWAGAMLDTLKQMGISDTSALGG